MLQHRIDGRNDRLQRIVEKVRHAQSPQNAECDAGRSPASVPIHRKIVLNGSSVAVRSSPFRKRQNPASGGSPAKNRPKVRISPVHPTESRSESSRSVSGRSPFCHKRPFPAVVTAEYRSARARSCRTLCSKPYRSAAKQKAAPETRSGLFMSEHSRTVGEEQPGLLSSSHATHRKRVLLREIHIRIGFGNGRSGKTDSYRPHRRSSLPRKS